MHISTWALIWGLPALTKAASAGSSSSLLHYTTPATTWNDALPLGQGRLGAMISGHPTSELLYLNEDSIWTPAWQDRVNPRALSSLSIVRSLLSQGQIVAAGRELLSGMTATKGEPARYQPLGNFTLDFEGIGEDRDAIEPGSYRRWLDVATATQGVEFASRAGVNYTREYIASYPAGVLGARIRASRAGMVSFRAELKREGQRRGGVEDGGRELWLAADELGGLGGVSFYSKARFELKGGNITAINNSTVVHVQGATEVVIWFAAETTYRTPNPQSKVTTLLSSVRRQSFSRIKAAAIADYKSLHSRVTLSLGSATPLNTTTSQLPTDQRLLAFKSGIPDPELVSLYFSFGRFMLIASSRPGSLPANLQGIWNKEYNPSWGSKYTVNINTEMNYWPALTTNLAETQQPLFNLVSDRLVPRGRDVAKRMYNVSAGWAAHHNTDLWGDAAPVDNGTAYSIWPMSGAWLSLHFLEHYRFTGDRSFLATHLPLIHEAVLFYFDFLIKNNDDEYWVTSPSLSPENRYRLPDGQTECITVGSTMDMQILHELFSGFIEASKTLGLTTDVQRAASYRSLLLPMVISPATGCIQEWSEDYTETEAGHRHVSHLFGLFPGSQITRSKNLTLFEAANATLARRLANGGAGTGWSRAWTINFFARLGEAGKMWENVDALIKGSTLPNLFDLHPPFQADGNYGGAAGVVEGLVQSHEEEKSEEEEEEEEKVRVVHLLPAVSGESLGYTQGKVTGLLARGGFVVDVLEWDEGKLVKARIRSRLGSRLRVKVGPGADGKVVVKGPDGGDGSAGTKKGGVYVVTPA